jgi:hypothetical protein
MVDLIAHCGDLFRYVECGNAPWSAVHTHALFALLVAAPRLSHSENAGTANYLLFLYTSNIDFSYTARRVLWHTHTRFVRV